MILSWLTEIKKAGVGGEKTEVVNLTTLGKTDGMQSFQNCRLSQNVCLGQSKMMQTLQL